jgi:PIN domain nuclease of toxin-antitoxin system
MGGRVEPAMTTDEPALAHLDTHILVWLYRNPHRAWPERVRVLLESARLRYSPMARLELHFLREIGRIEVAPAELLAELTGPLELQECGQPFGTVVEQAQALSWTRDPFDRLIVAQAMAAGAGLITHDENIRAHYAGAVWA